MRSVRSMVIVAICFLVTVFATFNVTFADPPILPNQEIIRSVLEAAEVDTTRIDELQRRVELEIAAVVDQFRNGNPNYRRARRLHQRLHKEHLLAYDSEADGFQPLVEEGRYNCLSATMFYGLIARGLGYETVVLATPGHLLLRLRIGDRTVDIETTTLLGFDSERHAVYTTHNENRATGMDGSGRYEQSGNRFWPVSLEEAVGFAWLNRAWRALDRSQTVEAAEAVQKAARFLTELPSKAEGARRLLARAFREEYDQGNFNRAYRIATIDVTLFPNVTTSRDRALAATLKRVETACDSDDPETAAAALETLQRAMPAEGDLERLERRTQPIIAAAAVRIQDWELARHAAWRYSLVQQDPVEAFHLLDWVAWREEIARPETAVCEDSPPGPGFVVSMF